MLIHANVDNFDNLINNKELCLVDFFATWCGPCQMIAEELGNIANNNKFDIIKVDVDENLELAMRYNINAVPTLIFFKNGVVKKVLQGYMSANKILQIAEGL